MGHPAQSAKKVTQEGMDILDCLGSLDKKVSLDHQANMVLLVLKGHQVFLEEDQEETLALLDHKVQGDFLAHQVFLDKMDSMEPKEIRDPQELLEDKGFLDYQEKKDLLEKRVKRAMLGCLDFLGQLDSEVIGAALVPQVFLVKRDRKGSQWL